MLFCIRNYKLLLISTLNLSFVDYLMNYGIKLTNLKFRHYTPPSSSLYYSKKPIQ